MAIAKRTAMTTWSGGLNHGSGEIRPDSGAFKALPVTWASRVERRCRPFVLFSDGPQPSTRRAPCGT